MTVISGDAGLVGTTNPKYKYMEFSDAVMQSDVFYSFFNSLSFNKTHINNTFYIAVYAYETSDITINVVVKRLSNSTVNNKT